MSYNGCPSKNVGKSNLITLSTGTQSSGSNVIIVFTSSIPIIWPLFPSYTGIRE